MAKKKKRRLMTDIYAEFPNANIYGEGDDMEISRGNLSNQIPIDIAPPQAQYNPSQFKRVNPIKYLTMSEQDRAIQNSERMRYNEWKKANPQPETTETNPSGSTDFGGVAGAAATGILGGIKDNDWSTKEGRTRGIFQSLGVADAANNWLADTTKGDANITEMHNRINDATNRYITDSNDTQGAFAAIKNNNNINLINPVVKGLSEKDFRQSWGSAWKNTLTGTLQGAAAGSVGGPWGALGGATVGTLSGLFGMFGRKNRARKAYEEYKNKMDYLQRFAGNFNSFQKLNQQQSNENLLNNGLKQQQIQDLSNIRAYGGNLDMSLISPNMIEIQNRALNNQKYKYDNQIPPTGFIDGGKTPTNGGYPRFAFGGCLNKFDFGGSLGLELPEDMQYYANGGTHEENPNGGIQVGVDNQGTPNLVEQGEFRYGDYVFSDRINVDASLLSEFNLAPATKHQNKKANKGKLSYADMAKKMVKKAGDLNDPITKDTIDANMSRLQQAQDAQKYKTQQDQEYADYKSALKTPTQGNPMYGSMKYNGMGDVNQGLNEGDAMAGSAIDNSELSNVNRSGNPMMAAYGGNIFKGGTNNLQIGTRKIVEPALNWDNLALKRSLPNPQFIEPIDYTQMARSNDSDWVNDKWDAYGELNNYYTPEQIANMRGTYGMSISGGVDKPFVQALQNDLKKRGYYTGSIDGIFGPKTRMALDKMNNTNAWTQNGKYIAPQTTTTVANGASNPSYTSTGKSFSYSTSSGNTVNKDVNYKDDPLIVSKNATASGTTQNPQQSVNSLGDLQRLNAQYATGNPFDAPSYNTSGKLATNAKFLPAVFADSTGFTNFDYDPNLAPNYDLVAAGKTGYIPRTADHSGMYREADLFDINAANNASQALNMAMLRGIVNNSNNNRGFLGAQTSALDYNGLMGSGQNFATMFDKNNASRIAAYQDNKQTEQTNVAANNDMYRDNQNAGIQAKQMKLNTLAQSMADQTQKELYADKTNREAHDNIAGNQNAMWNNTMQYFMDEAQRNDLYNKFNSDASQMWYYDKKLGKYVFKGDPAQAYLGTAMRTAENPVTSLDADLLKQYNDYVAKVGSQNVSKEFIDNLVYQQGQRNKEKEAKSIADRNAQMQSDIDFMNTQFQDLDNLTINDKDKSYKFFDYINSPKQVEAVRNFLANADVSQMNPNDYKNYKALLDNWMRMRDRQLMYRNQISPYNVADVTNTTWVGQNNESAYGGYINSRKKKKRRYYTDI